MAVPHGDRHDSSSQVEVPTTLVVVEPLHVPLMQQQRFLVDVVDGRRHVGGFQLLYLLEGWTLEVFSLEFYGKVGSE